MEHLRGGPVTTLHSRLPPAGSWRAWLAGGVAVTLGAVLKPLLDLAAGGVLPPFITLYPTVAIAGLIGGSRVGLASSAVSLLIAWWFWLAPYNSFAVERRLELVTLITFAFTSTALSLVCGYTREAFDAVAASEAEKLRAARETVHRIKNLLAVVQAIARKVARRSESVAEFQTQFEARLSGLRAAQDLLIQHSWKDASLDDLVQASLAPFLPNPALQVEPKDTIMVPARFISGLGLALYELATNAIKYGALRGLGGGVTLSWSNGADGRCELQWRETGAGDLPEAPAQGFGTALILSALNRESDTEVRHEVGSAGVIAIFRWPSGLAAPSRRTESAQ